MSENSDFDDVLEYLNSSSFSNETKRDKIRFGNKLVERNSDEYIIELRKNTKAVRETRYKKKRKLDESENKLKNIKEENQKLTTEILKVKDELDRLIMTFLKFDTTFKLPEDIVFQLKSIDIEMKS